MRDLLAHLPIPPASCQRGCPTSRRPRCHRGPSAVSRAACQPCWVTTSSSTVTSAPLSRRARRRASRCAGWMLRRWHEQPEPRENVHSRRPEARLFAHCAVIRSPTAVRPSLPAGRMPWNQQRGRSERATPTDGESTLRPHPYVGSAFQPSKRTPNADLTSVYAGQCLCGAPRRNRTGDPILTMEPPGTAVRTAVSAGHARPSGPKLSVLFRPSYAFTPVTAGCRWSRPSSRPTIANSARLPIDHLPLALGRTPQRSSEYNGSSGQKATAGTAASICPASTSTCHPGIRVTAPTSLARQAMATEQ